MRNKDRSEQRRAKPAAKGFETMARKSFEDDDPMELVQVLLPEGDAEAMAECFVEEFLWLGYDREQLLDLFRNPFYAGAHSIYRREGEGYVLGLIDRIRDRFGSARTGGRDG